MDKRLFKVLDEDFSSLVSFKYGKINVDSASALLLQGYFSGKNEWVEAIKEGEALDLECRSYCEYSEAIIFQAHECLNRFYLSTSKLARVAIIESLDRLCWSINEYCKGNIGGIRLGKGLSELKEKDLTDENKLNVWRNVLHPLQNDLLSIQQQEFRYINDYANRAHEERWKILESLPEEVRSAKSSLVDLVQEKEDLIVKTYDQIHICNAYNHMVAAVKGGDKKDIDVAYKDLIDQCNLANELNCSPYLGDLKPYFTFSKRKEMLDAFSDVDNKILGALMPVDRMAQDLKKSYLERLREDSVPYIDSTIDLAKSTGLLNQTFDFAALEGRKL